MTAAVSRDYSIIWGSFTCGATTERLIHGYPTATTAVTEDGTKTGMLAFQVSIRGTSDATFAANCAEMESEFSKRRQRIQFKIGTETFIDWNPTAGASGNTGFDQTASCEKVGTEGADTGRSRLYTCTLTAVLPNTDTTGRRNMSVSVEYTPSRLKLVTIEGSFTAVTTADATAQYAAQIAAIVTSVLSAVGGTYDTNPIHEKTERNDQDKVIEFVRVYREKVFNQSAGGLNHAAVVEDSLNFRRIKSQPGDSRKGIKRLEDIVVTYGCSVDRNSVTGVDSLESLYDDTVRPHIISTFEASPYSPSQYAVINEEKIVDPVQNVIGAALVFRAVIDAQDVIESVERRRIVEDPEVVLTGAWTGKSFAKYVDYGIGTRRRFSIRAIRKLGTHFPIQRIAGANGEMYGEDFGSGGSGGGGVKIAGPGGGKIAGPGDQVPGGAGRPGAGGAGGGRWVLIGNDSEANVQTAGQPDGSQFTYTDLIESYVEEWVVEPGRGSGSPITPPT